MKSTSALARLAILAAILLAPCAGCGERGDPIRATLDRIVRAAHDRDASAVAACLAPEYRDATGGGREEIERTLRGYFAAYDVVNVTLSHVEIERAERAARARFRAVLSAQPAKAAGLAGLLPSSAAYRFDVRLVPSGSRWKVAWASWEPDESR